MSRLSARELESTVAALLGGALPDKGSRFEADRDLNMYRWCDRNAQQIRVAVAAALDAMPDPERGERVGDMAPRTRDELRAYLDDTPPTGTARTVIRPPFPMTLGDVRRLLDIPAPNPAPLRRVRGHAGARYAQSGDKGEYGEMWAISAPEGFPPYPRRGAEYNEDEARAVSGWLSMIWPAYQELLLYAQRRDRELMRAGVSMSVLQQMLAGSRGTSYGTDTLYGYIGGGDHNAVPTTGRLTGAIGRGETTYAKTPRAVAEAATDYARQYIGPALRLLDGMRDASMIARKSDPAEIDAQVEWAKQIGLRPEAIWRLYVGHQHRSDTVAARFFPEPWRTRLSRMSERDMLLAPDLTTPDGAPVPLSAQIVAKQNKDLDYERRTKDLLAARKVAADLLRADLKGMKGISTPALEARGWTVTQDHHVEREGVTAWWPTKHGAWTAQLRAWAEEVP